MFPFKEKKINDRLLLREFSNTHVSSDQMWHRDRENRTIIVVESGGWSFQKDNQLPVLLKEGDRIKIQKEEWHRVIKGDGKLVVKVILEDSMKEKDLQEDEFSYKIAQAAVDGKKTVKIGNKDYPVKMSKEKAKQILDEEDRMQEADKMPAGYKAKKGTKRGDKLRALTQRYKNAKTEKQKKDARDARDAYEAKIAKKNTYGKPKKSQYSEALASDEDVLREFIRDVLVLEKKKKKKKKGGSRKISSKVDKALKAKAKKHNAPVGALKAVYRKGIGAFYTSGSRPGQNPHSWAMGRVNSFLKGGKARQVDSAQWNQVKKHRKK